MKDLFASLPSVDACLTALSSLPDGEAVPHNLLRSLVQRFLEDRRADIRAGRVADPQALKLPALLPGLAAFARQGARPVLRRVLNATGVVIHTNLGRSLLAEEAVRAAALAAGNYCNLEYDLDTGARGSRHHLIEGLVCSLTGAEAALAVNNNAAAVLLTLDSLCRGGEVVVSRGQLVEIGGSFRIPEVMARSGAILREVGTTNRTHLADYQAALGDDTRALLAVHTSNYRICGFHSAVSTRDMAELAHARGLPLLADLGSGCLVDFSPFGLPGEPTVRETLNAGADVVTFSGDKALGGPQAGIIAGKAEYIEAIRKNQLLRALRCDKMTLAALEATLRLYLDPQAALARIPTLRMITLPPAELARLARKLRGRLKKALPPEVSASLNISLEKGASRVGGGTFPERELPTTLVRLSSPFVSAEALRAKLLQSDPPLIGRVERDGFLLDPRTLSERDFDEAGRLLAEAIA